MALFRQLAPDIIRTIFTEWCGAREFAHVQVVLTISPRFLAAFANTSLSIKTYECALRRMQTSERYADVLELLRQVPVRGDSVSYGWMQPWLWSKWRWLEAMRIAMNVITTDTFAFDPVPDWVIRHAHTLQLTDVFAESFELPSNIHTVIWNKLMFPYRPGKPWPFVETLVWNDDYTVGYQWPSVHTLHVNWYNRSSSIVVDINDFPVLCELSLSGLVASPEVLNWHAATSLERLRYWGSSSYYRDSIDPPSMVLPKLRHMTIGDDNPAWVTFAMTLQAPLLESLALDLNDFRIHQPCPRLTKLVFYHSRSFLPSIPATHFPVLCEIVLKRIPSEDLSVWLASLPATVVTVRVHQVVYTRMCVKGSVGADTWKWSPTATPQ